MANTPRMTPSIKESTPTAATEQSQMVALEKLGTTLSRVRCILPAQIDRMKTTLAAHGQLTPLTAVRRGRGLQILDGFKRHRSAEQMGWTSLRVTEIALDERAQWAMMLLLNRGPHAMSVLEEAMVLRELTQSGLTQTQVGELVQRHKSWVSRRIGLLERLHPELVEQMKLGLLSAGIARRLLVLPPGNQLQMAAAVSHARLGPHQTEVLVSQWQRLGPGEARDALLRAPREALDHLRPQAPVPPSDPRLGAHGQQIQRLLHRVEQTAAHLTALLRHPPMGAELTILARSLRTSLEMLSQLTCVLGSLTKNAAVGLSDASGAIS